MRNLDEVDVIFNILVEETISSRKKYFYMEKKFREGDWSKVSIPSDLECLSKEIASYDLVSAPSSYLIISESFKNKEDPLVAGIHGGKGYDPSTFRSLTAEEQKDLVSYITHERK